MTAYKMAFPRVAYKMAFPRAVTLPSASGNGGTSILSLKMVPHKKFITFSYDLG
jgi:hypothetical protein